MSSKFVRAIVFLVMLVSLPLQGLAAITMPSCKMNEQVVDVHASVEKSADMDMQSCHHHDADSKNKTDNKECAKCSFCVLSHSIGFVPENPTVRLAGNPPQYPTELSVLPNQIQYSLFRPPRHTSA